MIRATLGKEGRQVDSVYGLLSDLWFECHTDICAATCSQMQNMFPVYTNNLGYINVGIGDWHCMLLECIYMVRLVDSCISS